MSRSKSSLGDPKDHTDVRQGIIDTCIEMGRIGINQGTSGNVSARVPGGFLITPSGIPYEKMTPEIVCFMDEEGRYYGVKLPSSEWRIHFDIYKVRPDANAIVHAHPTFSTALSVHQRTVPAFHSMVAAVGGTGIRCAKYATFGSKDLSDNIIGAMSGGLKACLMANHGIVAYGANMDKALWLANLVECLSKQYVTASKLGPPTILSNEEMEVIVANKKATEVEQGEFSVGDLRDHMEMRRELINISIEMEKMGISKGCSDNISTRIPGGMLITPAGIPWKRMEPDMIIFVDKDATLRDCKLPSSEWNIHQDLYKARPDVNAIVSAQPTYATALSSHRVAIPAFHYMIAVAGGKEIRCAKYATLWSEEASENILNAMSGGLRACLVPNHGIVACGDNLRRAVWLANEVECLSKQYVTACELGPLSLLGNEEMDVILTKFKTYGKQPEEVASMSLFEQEHAVVPPPRATHTKDADEGDGLKKPVNLEVLLKHYHWLLKRHSP